MFCRKKYFFFIAVNMLIQILILFQAVCFADGKETCVMKLKSNSFFFPERKCSDLDHSRHISSKMNRNEKYSSCSAGS